MVTKVPLSVLHGQPPDLVADRTNGVWLCYGFGYHGTYLAPGAAHLLGEMMYGQRADLYNGEYGLLGADREEKEATEEQDVVV